MPTETGPSRWSESYQIQALLKYFNHNKPLVVFETPAGDDNLFLKAQQGLIGGPSESRLQRAVGTTL
jgi:hypothetical protein